MKRYSIFHIPVWSFFSKALYSDVCHRWKGTGFAYLLWLLAICWIAPMVRVHVGLSRFVENEAPKIVSQIPAISIVDGNASINEPQPYYIHDPETGTNLVVIDTTGAMTSLEDAKAFGLITKTQAIFRQSDVETRTFNFRGIDRFTLDQARIRGWLTALKKVLAPALYPFVVLGSFIAKILQLLVYAAIGMLFASWCKCRRTYAELLRLSVVAITPCIIIRTILDEAQVQVPVAGLLYFLCAMGFLFFGVKAAAQDEGPTPASTLSQVPRGG